MAQPKGCAVFLCTWNLLFSAQLGISLFRVLGFYRIREMERPVLLPATGKARQSIACHLPECYVRINHNGEQGSRTVAGRERKEWIRITQGKASEENGLPKAVK